MTYGHLPDLIFDDFEVKFCRFWCLKASNEHLKLIFVKQSFLHQSDL